MEARISRIYDALESGAGFDPDDLAPRISQLRKSQLELREKAEGLPVLPAPADTPAARERLGNFLMGMLAGSSIETRIRMLKGMGVRVFVWKDRIEIKADPSRVLASSGEGSEGFAESSEWRAKVPRRTNTPRTEYTGRFVLARPATGQKTP